MVCVMCSPQRLGPVEVLPSQSELAQIVLGVNVRLADEESASEWGTGWEDLGARPGSAGHATLPHSVDQNSVTHTQLSVRGRLGWWSLCVSSRKGKQGVSLRHRRIQENFFSTVTFSLIIWYKKKTSSPSTLKSVLYICEFFSIYPSPKPAKHSAFLPSLPFPARSLTTHPLGYGQKETQLFSSLLFPVSSTIT